MRVCFVCVVERTRMRTWAGAFDRRNKKEKKQRGVLLAGLPGVYLRGSLDREGRLDAAVGGEEGGKRLGAHRGHGDALRLQILERLGNVENRLDTRRNLFSGS